MNYTGHRLYTLLAALCVVLVLLFAWQLYNRWDWGSLLFAVIAAWSAVRCLFLMSSSVELTEDRLRVKRAGRTTHEVEFRQLSAVYEEGRGLKSVLLLYHPRTESGLLALDEEISLLLPAVNEHEALLAALSARVQP